MITKTNKSNADIYYPTGKDEKITKLCIAAHQDDVEIMAYGQIAECYGSNSFGAVVMTDGAGSPRTGKFADMTDEDMKKVRVIEQRKAADVGAYGVLFQLGYSSAEVKSGSADAVKDLEKIILELKPDEVFIHNFADKHDTHVASALRALTALRNIKGVYKPAKVYCLEVWRGLDWLSDDEKAVFDTSKHPQLACDILDVYESQIAGGKEYRQAAIGRRLGNATFYASHSVDSATSLSYGLEITDMVYSDMSPAEFILSKIDDFKKDVENKLSKFS